MGVVRKGIDVSEHQGKIDWAKVAADGVEFAIIRCGYGKDIARQDDKYFEQNYAGAKAHGIKVGVYLYSYAKDADSARSEAAHVLRLLKGKTLDLPVYYDLEESGLEGNYVEHANIFGDIVEGAGYWVGVYSGAWHWKNTLKDLTRFTKWIASWGKNTTTDLDRYADVSVPSGAEIHQFSAVGKVDGIKGNVDLDVMYRDLVSDIAVWAGKQTDNYVTVDGDTVATVTAKTGADVSALKVVPGQTVKMVKPDVFDWSKIKHFDREEFRCKCGGKHCDGYPAEPEPKLVKLCEQVREHFNAPFIISSGVRCVVHNANVGGVTNSRHKRGKAVDFRIRGKTAAEVLAYVKTLPVRYCYDIDGTYVHMDVE